ncbi:MAG: DUF58 domain-containing protein [Rhizobiaceae bacterium]|nr:DUF58 domain-containing protein [Rhizobiaceae bacterium]
MSNQIGQISQREAGNDTLSRARARAAFIPDLLVEASRVANNVFTGWHGRRKRGIGENFWQFRPYVQGESMAAIDWRRSARDDQLYVRDREWQAAHTIWLWVDESPSMLFCSDQAQVSKHSRALVLAFAMAELLARSGERIGWLGLSRPIVTRNAAEKLASILISSPPQTQFPSTVELKGFSDIIIFSDFLDPINKTIEKVGRLARRGIRGHLVQIVDPVEEKFPYSGRVEFSDPETGDLYTTGNARSIRDDYENLFAARIQALHNTATKFGWSHTLHHTDNLASQALIALHTRLSGNPVHLASSKGSSR